VIAATTVVGTATRAQDIEPRAYSNAPIGTNFLIAGYAFSSGALSFDTLPLTDARLHTNMLALGYVHTFGVLGMAAKVDVLVPYGWLNGTASTTARTCSAVPNQARMTRAKSMASQSGSRITRTMALAASSSPAKVMNTTVAAMP